MKKAISVVMAGFVAVAMGTMAFATDVNVTVNGAKVQAGKNGKVTISVEQKKVKENKKAKENRKVKLTEEQAKAAMLVKLDALKAAADAYKPVKATYDAAKTAYKADESNVAKKEAYKAASKALNKAKKAYNKAKTAYNKAYAKFKAAGGTDAKVVVKLDKGNRGVVTPVNPTTQPAVTVTPDAVTVTPNAVNVQ